MKSLRCRLVPESAFATPLRGDTLFGQVCWALRYRHGEAALQGWLEGYTADRPFLIVSDAFPAGYLPRPALPPAMLGLAVADPARRKQLKSLAWVPLAALDEPLHCWGALALSDMDLAAAAGYARRNAVRQHNSLNRLTLATGKGAGFAPFTRELHWYGPETTLDVLVLLDDERISAEAVHQVLVDVGTTGYGKEASTGAGRFRVAECVEVEARQQDDKQALLTLAPCAPQGGAWDAARCWYRPFVRFGRHGDMAVHGRNPFKNPVLLADTAAVLTPRDGLAITHVGRGLGGVSLNLPGTVQQGYAPVLPVRLGQESAA